MWINCKMMCDVCNTRIDLVDHISWVKNKRNMHAHTSCKNSLPVVSGEYTLMKVTRLP